MTSLYECNAEHMPGLPWLLQHDHVHLCAKVHCCFPCNTELVMLWAGLASTVLLCYMCSALLFGTIFGKAAQ